MEDRTGIELEELYARKELEVLTLPFTMLGEVGKDLLISGVALTEGVWKNVIYSASEIKKVAKELIGKPILVEHGNTKEFQNKEVGKVVKSYFEPSLRGIVFEAHVSDPFAKKLVKKGVLPAVSCSTWMDKKPVNETIRVGTGYIFAELSLVRVPACDKCYIFHQEQLSKFSQGKDLKELMEREINTEDINMSEEEMESLSDIEEEEEELMDLEELEAPKLYAVLELPDEETLESLRRVKRVVSYYYGYPYYSPYGSPYGSPYKYPYKYPYRKKLSEEEPVILAVVELSDKEELVDLKKTYKVIRYYYGQYGYPGKYGYPSYGYPYGYKYPYAYPRKTKYRRRLSTEELSDIKAELREVMKEFQGEAPPTAKGQELETGPLMKHQVGAPNPEQCAEVECPVCGKKFPDEKAFLDHWNKEHKQAYGDFKETMTILDALSRVVDLAKGDTKIVKTKKGRFIAFVDTGKEGFGQWKIVGNFATEKEARDALKTKEKGQKYPAPGYEGDFKCPVCGKVFKTKDDLLKHWAKEHQEKYGVYGKKSTYGKPAKMKKEFICPACKKAFGTEKELAEHWRKKHKAKYGTLKKGYKYPEKKAKKYYYYKYKGKYYPYYYQKGKYYRKYSYPKKK